MTLRLVVSIATKVICDDSDGPGHAPRYLDVRPKLIFEIALGIMNQQLMPIWGFSRLRLSSGDGSRRGIGVSGWRINSELDNIDGEVPFFRS